MDLLEELVTTYAKADLKDLFDKVDLESDKIDASRRQLLKEVSLAQWLLESGRATSLLATTCLNFSGLKWRVEMTGLAKPELIKVPSEPEAVDFCKFNSVDAFFVGYWKFLTRSPYTGLQDHTNTPETFLGFLQRKGFCC